MISLSFQIATAQTWFEPPLAPAAPNTDSPLYGGNDAAYGGNTQWRTGQLTIREDSASTFSCAGSMPVCVEGTEMIEQALTVGSLVGLTPPDATVTALSETKYGVYGISTSANPLSAGVYGKTQIIGGRGLIGDAGSYDSAVGVKGFAQGAGSKAIAGTSVSGYAGYFEGPVLIDNSLGTGSLTVSNDATFNANVAVTSQLSVGSLSMLGVPFTASTVNSRSVQDKTLINPVDLPGIQTFTLTSSEAGAFCTGCNTTDGKIAVGATVSWLLGPTSPDADKRLLDDTTVVLGYTAQYLGKDASEIFRDYYDFIPATQADLEYQECTGVGFQPLNKFTLKNTTGAEAIFRLVVWYKDYTTKETCFDYSYRRQITVMEGVDQNDSIQIKLTGAAALDLYNKSATPTKGDDVRVYYNGTEIDRDVVTFTSADVEIWFRSHLAPEGPDSTNYLLLYGNASATNPPKNKANVYYFFDDFENGLYTDKWTEYTIDTDSSVTESGGKLNLNHNIQSYNQYTGVSAYITTPLDKTGYYTIKYELTPLINEDGAPPTEGNLGNDGVFLRNTTVNRDGTYYGVPTEKSIWFGMVKTCAQSSTGGWLRTRGAAAATWTCIWPNSIGQYSLAYIDGVPKNYVLTLYTNTGAVAYQQPGGTTRISGTANAADYGTIGTTDNKFVIELHDGYGDGENFNGNSPGGAEKYDNFTVIRGKNSPAPPVTLSGEL